MPRPSPLWSLLPALLVILSLTAPLAGSATPHPGAGGGGAPRGWAAGDASAWTPVDTSNYSVKVVGEDVGSLEGQGFAGWYTDTAVVDPDTGTVVIAWARLDVDSEGDDLVFLGFMKPVDADEDGKPEAYQKIVKYVTETQLVSLDSLSIGTIGGVKYVLLTWTYYESGYENNVGAALFTIDGSLAWEGTVRGTTYYEEYSRSCYVPSYNNGDGGFLIVWYTSYDDSVDGKWLYYDPASGWTLTAYFNVADTNNLYYEKADQMLCIGGQSRALVAYRKWDSSEGEPDLYAALVATDNTVTDVKLYDYDGSEETVGVRGAYAGGYFLVPLLSGTHVRYDIVVESNATVIHRDYVTSNGTQPYAVALSDRFVLAWIDYYNDNNGEPKVAQVDLTNFYIHPEYGVSVTGGDSYYDMHPLIAPYESGGSEYLLYIWSSSSDGSNYDIKYAIVSLGSPTDTPIVQSTGTLLQLGGDQRAQGLGAVSDSQYVVAYTDTSDGEEDLMAYAALPGVEEVANATVYTLPGDASEYKSLLLNLIGNAQESVYVAVAYFQEDNPGAEGTISKALVDAKNRGVDVRVIIDNSTANTPVYEYLKENGVPVINDSSAVDPEHIMHDKFIVVDGYKLVVATANLIEDDLSRDNNTALYIESRALAHFYQGEFLEMWNDGNGLFGSQKSVDNSFIAFTSINGRTVVFEGYFSPQSYGDKGRIPNIVSGYITRATGSVYFACYIFTTSGWVTPVYNAIIDAHNSGLDVRGVFDEEMNLDTPGRRIYWLVDEGVPLAVDIHPYKMHAKLFVIDNETAILGSWNPTRSATLIHDENILVIRDPDTASQLAGYILSMYNDQQHFTRSPYQYNPPHPVIDKVMYMPDQSGQPTREWVELYNPTDEQVNLSGYVIGDSDDLIHGDNESMYAFPPTAVIQPHGYLVIAYNATAFKEDYGFYPDYEIVDSTSQVPDLQPYQPDKFTGSWNLSDEGDEVILAQEGGNGFLRVVDAVWWGDSQYMNTSIGQPNSAAPLDTSAAAPGDAIVDKAWAGESSYWDALRMSDKYTIQSSPPPIPEPGLLAGLAAALTATLLLLNRKLGRRPH